MVRTGSAQMAKIFYALSETRAVAQAPIVTINASGR